MRKMCVLVLWRWGRSHSFLLSRARVLTGDRFAGFLGGSGEAGNERSGELTQAEALGEF